MTPIAAPFSSPRRGTLRRSATLVATAAAVLASTSAPARPADAMQGSAARPAASRAVAARDITVLIAGDLLGPYDDALAAGDPAFERVIALVRQADAAFANQEGSSFDTATTPAILAAENGGGYPIHTLETMRGYKAAGLDLLSRANNHSTDWGAEGMTASDRALDAIGFTRAGTGPSLEAARRPGVFTTPTGERVALVATASTFTGLSPAGDPGRGVGPRPGLNPLTVKPFQRVTRDEFAVLSRIATRGGWQGRDMPDANSREVFVGDAAYRLSDTPGLGFDVSPADRSAILASVGQARDAAGTVIFSIHAHETASGGYEDPAPADFLPPLFHDAIDRGADVVARHGPHAVQGIEIYNGRPIFYGLGHFYFSLPRSLTVTEAGQTRVVPFPDTWWQGAVATVRLVAGRVREVRVYPLTIRSGEGGGAPALATGAAARQILDTIRARSKRYGTDLRIVGDIGVIDRF